MADLNANDLVRHLKTLQEFNQLAQQSIMDVFEMKINTLTVQMIMAVNLQFDRQIVMHCRFKINETLFETSSPLSADEVNKIKTNRDYDMLKEMFITEISKSIAKILTSSDQMAQTVKNL